MESKDLMNSQEEISGNENEIKENISGVNEVVSEESATSVQNEEELNSNSSSVNNEIVQEEAQLPTSSIDIDEPQVSNADIDILSKDDNEFEIDLEDELDIEEDDHANSVLVASVHEGEIIKELDTVIDYEKIDLSGLSKVELVDRMSHLLESVSISAIRQEINEIRDRYLVIYNQELETLKSSFVEQGGEEADFVTPEDATTQKLNELLLVFRNRRVDIAKSYEEEKKQNLKIKLALIEDLKSLIKTEEAISFKQFKEIQDKWKSVGQVPRGDSKGLYETYHLYVEQFYDLIKMDKELRDYDLKKNLEKKIELCEKAENLAIQEDVKKSFDDLQDLHKEWREVGPVPKEEKEVVWERFKAATAAINKLHQHHYNDLRKVQKDNFDKKTELCEKVEAICNENFDNPKLWNIKADEILEIQKAWREIGFAPKKFNSKIYDRFRSACDKFFEMKRDYYQGYKDSQDGNLDEKRKLVALAETLKESKDWKHATEEFIKIQKQWKQIGPVPRKYSDAIWKKFREACDYFFEEKTKFFGSVDSVQDENLAKKKALIEQIVNFELLADAQENTKAIQQFREEWSKIGHVPLKQKDAVSNEFRNAINKIYDKLNINERDRDMEKYRSKISEYSNENNDRLYGERNKMINKLRTLESEIAVWENNIGFFSKSGKANDFVKNFEKKIAEGKEQIKTLSDKIKLIDSVDDDSNNA